MVLLGNPTFFPSHTTTIPLAIAVGFLAALVVMPPFSLRSPRLLRQQSSLWKPVGPKSLPLDVPIDEERAPGYDRQSFFHPNPGDVLDDRYALKAKIGWGSSSTVWLAQEKRRSWFGSGKYFAVKINANNYSHGEATRELDMSKHISSANKRHWGHNLVVTAINHFNIESPKGPHVCLVFEPMRESLYLFRRRLGADKVTPDGLPLIKLYIRGMLHALDYLHSECHVIHTDLKLDNILMTFEHTSVIERFVEAQSKNPMPRKILGDRTVYLCHNDFGDIQEKHLQNLVPKIADFGLAQRGDGAQPLIHPIQPNHCHAPEVLLGTGWSYSADMWNFGVMLWDPLAGKELFLGRQSKELRYSAAHHLAEMIALLGPVPPALLQRERDMRHWSWKPEIPNADGVLCNNAAGYFGGPFFSDGGKFMHNSLIPFHRQLGNERPDCIAEEDKRSFLNFIKRMLRWIPEERATARELLEDPWLIL